MTGPARTHASTSWSGAPGEFRPPRYASPQALQADGTLYPTAGRRVGRWIQRDLVHGEGDVLGERIRYQLFQWYLLNRMYEFEPTTGRLLHDTMLFIIAKGNAKTEMVGQIGDAEMMGPLAPIRSPRVTISAASWKQANELLTAAQLAITGSEEQPGPLASQFQRGLHLLDDKILAPTGGRLTRLAAVGGTADGGKETCHLGDELHEWAGERAERMWVVKGRSLRKRVVPRGTCATCVTKDPVGRDMPGELIAVRGRGPVHVDRALERDHVALPIRGSIQVAISTVGDDPTVVTDNPSTLLARLYRKGVDVAEGKAIDPRFLFVCWQAEENLDLDNDFDLTQAILQANPAAGSFLSIDEKKRSILDPLVSRSEGERYDLSLWSTAMDAWLSLKLWQGRTHPTLRQPPAGTEISLGFDGSKSRDSTALWGCTMQGHLFRVALWERPKNAPDGWTVERHDVDREMKAAFSTWKVRVLQYDPPRWEHEGEEWAAWWPGRVLAFETDVYERFAPAVGRLHDGVVGEKPTVTHDGDPDLARHIANARAKETRWGQVITKEHKDSPRRIDGAVAAVLAHDGISVPMKKVDRVMRGTY